MSKLPKNGIIYFGTMACGHGYIESKLIVKLYQKHYPLVIPNDNEISEWIKELNVRQFPSFVIMKNGQLKEIFDGFLAESQILTIVKYYFSEEVNHNGKIS
ncbi:thioredoxin family protein [Lactobacillus rodentium]|uniref:Thioredoxin n=1 Tax=Lactobacillus rodentium TaxID=947835 RepID=A0A2Z6TDC8_9LACO|nr:thioredoxin family protein [Lactobacillus rodentium]MCR1894025.1 thioredoxin family protein [Lactobacillus rodentium]GBG04110.1 hypothetical protein LrDSM24759_00240 [Lactobacillus rodentium]